jgi:hypothetical protein
MEQEWPKKISIEQPLHSRLVEWCEADRISIVVLCEMFEEFGLDAVYSRSEHGTIPSTCPDGHLERAVFEVKLTFGTKAFQIFRVGPDEYALSD